MSSGNIARPGAGCAPRGRVCSSRQAAVAVGGRGQVSPGLVVGPPALLRPCAHRRALARHPGGAPHAPLHAARGMPANDSRACHGHGAHPWYTACRTAMPEGAADLTNTGAPPTITAHSSTRHTCAAGMHHIPPAATPRTQAPAEHHDCVLSPAHKCWRAIATARHDCRPRIAREARPMGLHMCAHRTPPQVCARSVPQPISSTPHRVLPDCCAVPQRPT